MPALPKTPAKPGLGRQPGPAERGGAQVPLRSYLGFMSIASLSDALPQPGETLSSDDLLLRFLEVQTLRGMELYPAQEEALLELCEGKNVILNTPTGSGKSLVASGLHFLSMAQGRRSVYTCPIKARVAARISLRVRSSRVSPSL